MAVAAELTLGRVGLPIKNAIVGWFDAVS